MTLLFVGLCAVVVGFAIQRGTTCVVRAVDDLVTRGRPGLFLGFLECALWVGAAYGIGSLFGLSGFPPAGFELTVLTVAGGALFGIGAVVNGACAFGSVAKLGSGRIDFVATFPAALLGAWLASSVLPLEAPVRVTYDSPVSSGLPLVLWLALVTGVPVLRLIQAVRLGVRRAWSRVRANAWPVPLAIAVIALGNGGILMSKYDWPWMRLASGLGARQLELTPSSLTLLGCLLGGALVGGITSKRFAIAQATAGQALRCAAGGLMMGIAVKVVPGGNDTLILQSLPFAWPHALTAYGAMCVAVGVSLLIVRVASGWRSAVGER